MKIAEVVRTKGRAVATIHPEQSVGSAVREMRHWGVGALVVTRDGTHLVGIVSERDVVRALVDTPDVLDRRVSDIMTTTVVTCSPDDTVTHAMALVTQRRHRHLPVIVAGELAGIVSIGDLVKARLEELELESRVLRQAVITSH
jgi:CBS domain-containing protein